MAFTSRTDGQLCLSTLGKNLTSNAVDVYRLTIETGDEVNFPLDNLSSGNYDFQGVRDRSGKIVGQVQLDEQDPKGEFGFTVFEDFDYINTKYVYGNSKSRMINLFQGEAFVNDDAIIVPIGTNGTDKTDTAIAKFHEMNKPYKYLYHNEGSFIRVAGTADKKGRVALTKNPYEASLNKTSKTICLEYMTTTGQAQVNRMLARVAKTSLEITEGDINKISFNGQKGCDAFERDDFYTAIYPEKADESAEIIKELYVKAIIKHGATEVSTGTKGDLIAVLDDNGNVTIKKYNSSSYEQDRALEGKLQVGTRIKSNTLREASTSDQTVNCFIALGEDKKAIDFSTDGSKRFYCKVYDFNRTEGKFVELKTEL